MRDRELDLTPYLPLRRRWRLPAGSALCGSVAIGSPIDVHLFGGHLLSDLGPVAVVLALFAGAVFWLFRRFGGPSRAVAADSDRIWAELEACGCDPSCDPAEDEPDQHEPVEREPIRA